MFDKREKTIQEIFLKKFQEKEHIDKIKEYYNNNKFKISLIQKDEDDYYPLHQLIYLKNYNYIQFIVENLPNKKEDINLVDNIGNSALHLCAVFKNVSDILTYLIQQGANVNLQNDKKQTPLHLACGKNIIDNVNVLISTLDIDYNIKDYQGFTPLIKACASQSYEVVKELIKIPEIINNINIRDNLGNTCLHYLCEDEKNEIVISILKIGGNLEIKNNNDKTPLDLIKNQDVKDILKFYLENNQQDI